MKDYEELCNKTYDHFKDKARKECLWERFVNCHKLSVKVCKIWFELQRTCYGNLTQSKFGQALKEMTECQNWIQDIFGILRLHIRCKRLSKSLGFKSQARGANASAASAQNICRASTDTVWRLACSQQTPHYSLNKSRAPPELQGTLVIQQAMDPFTQMRTVLSSFLGQKQETIKCTAFCNYLVLEV